MSDQKAVTPRPAATILLCRDGSDGLEVFMVVRHRQIEFASGALVFPGGKVEESDAHLDVAERCDGVDPSDSLFTYEVAAIRETYEECGVLLAREAEGDALITGERLRALESSRDKLNSGDLTFVAFLKQEDLRLACDHLIRFAHWITPAMVPKRFDTQFFIAKAPEDHLAVHDGSESVDSIWITPKDVLEQAEADKWNIMFPTRLNLQKLNESTTVDEAMASARARTIVTVEPQFEARDEGNFILIPPEAGYSISEEKFVRP